MGLEALKAEALDSDGRETLSTVIASTEDIHNVLEIFRAQVKEFYRTPLYLILQSSKIFLLSSEISNCESICQVEAYQS